jgi:hypothetical protein
MNNCDLMFRTLIIALLSIATWATVAVAGVSNDHRHISYLASLSSSVAVKDADVCCHQPSDDQCHPLSSRNTSTLLAPKQAALDPAPAADLAYIDLMPNRLLCETGTSCYSDLPHSIVTSPVYLTTLRLRL